MWCKLNHITLSCPIKCQPSIITLLYFTWWTLHRSQVMIKYFRSARTRFSIKEHDAMIENLDDENNRVNRNWPLNQEHKAMQSIISNQFNYHLHICFRIFFLSLSLLMFKFRFCHVYFNAKNFNGKNRNALFSFTTL